MTHTVAELPLDEFRTSIDVHNLGQCFTSEDQVLTSRGNLTIRSSRPVKYRLVQNTSGGALLPSRAVKYAAGEHGLKVDGYAADGGDFAGVVCPFIPSSGVPDDAYFWIVVEGPATVLTNPAADLANAITVGADVAFFTGGYIRLAAGTEHKNLAGWAQEAKAVDARGTLCAVVLRQR